MKRFRFSLLSKVMAFVAAAMFALPFNAMAAATTKIKHKPIKYFVAEKRIQISAKIKDKAGINLVRCYFKATGEANHVFVPMAAGGDGKYQAILPSPGTNTPAIEYLFLVVNKANQIVKSQSFKVGQKKGADTPAWQKGSQSGDITVSTELEKATPPEGFSDSITMDTVESTARFGIVAGGIYLLLDDSESSAATGAAAAATLEGTVSASSGLSALAWTGIGVAAVGGGAVAVAASDSSGGGSDLPGGTGEVKVTLQWSDCNDLDLQVIDPCGNTISFSNKTASCAGHTGSLDVDANFSGCSSRPAENIFWTTAPTGTFQVRVNYYNGSGASTYKVTTIVDGTRTEFNNSIASGTQSVTTFSR